MTSMVKYALLVGTALALTPAAFAQGRIIGTEAVDDQIRDVERETADRFEDAEDESRFGFGAYPEGFSGSFSAAGSVQDGNTNNADATIGGRMRYATGPNNFSFGALYTYGADENSKGDRESNENSLYLTADYNRYLTEQFYLFGIGLYEYDEFGAIEHDAFLGFGPGYRIFNDPNVAWRVQIGPGVRYTKDAFNDEETELAGIASSRFYYKFNDNVFFTNDTDVLFSDTNTNVVNDAGINFKMTDALSTRVSYLTDYNSDPLPGYDSTDNKLQFAVVYSFN